MVNTFDSVTEQKWATEAHIAWEQRKSKFEGRCREVRAPAKTYNFQVFTDTPYHTSKARNAPVIIDAQNVADVTATSSLIYTARMIDFADEAVVNFDYRSAITQECVNQCAQAIDDTIITALMTFTSSNLGSSLPTAYTSNYAGLAYVAQQLNLANVPLEDRHCVLTPAGYNSELLVDSAYINNFHVVQEATATGEITGGLAASLNTFWSSRLDTGTEGGSKTCFAWHKNSVGVLFTKDFSIDIAWEPLYQGWLFCGRVIVGATIIDNTGVIAFDVV